MRLLLPFLFVFMVHTVTGQTNIPVQVHASDSVFASITHGDSVQFFVGKTISVTGIVVSVKQNNIENGIAYYLDFFKCWPDNPFSVAIFKKNVDLFAPVEQYSGKTVRLTGKVRRFLDKKTRLERFSITLRTPDQVEIVKG